MEKRKPIVNRAKRGNSPFIKGIRPVLEAIDAGREIEKVLIQHGLTGNTVKELRLKLTDLHIPVQTVPVEKLNRITRSNHQGIIAYISGIIYASLDHVISSVFQRGQSPRVIILDRISDVRNFGAIARTVEVLGFDAIIIPLRGGAMINEDAMKTSAGALNHIPVCREADLAGTVRYLKECGMEVFACTEKATENLYAQDLTGPLALMFGSEEDGISPALLKAANRLVQIPMRGKIASLNVSVSVAIAAAEVMRQCT